MIIRLQAKRKNLMTPHKWLVVQWAKKNAILLLDILLPHNIHGGDGPQEKFQARIFIGFCAIISVMLLPIAVSDVIVYGFFHYDPIQTISIIILFIVCLILFGVFNYRVTAFNLLLSGGLGLYFFSIYTSGGLYSSAMIWMPIIPFIIAYYRGSIITLWIGCLFILFVVAIWLLQVYEHDFTIFNSDENNGYNIVFVEYISAIMTAVLLAIFLRYARDLLENDLKLKTRMYQITSDAFEENRILLKTILNTVPQEISVKALDGRFLLVNRTFASAWGKNSEDILGMNVFDLAPEHPNETELIARTDQEVIENGEILELTTTRGLSEKDLSYYHVIKSPLWNNSREIIGIVEVGIDITKRVKAEQRAIVLERMAAIIQVCGGVCHNFNNINQIILGNLALLDDKYQKNKRTIIQKIQDQVQRATDINKQLITYSREMLSVKKSVVNINKLVARAVQLLRSEAYSPLTIYHNPHPSLWNAIINPDDFEKILGYLVKNAQDAIDGEGTLEFKTFNLEISESTMKPDPEMGEGAYVCMSVTDSGCGISLADSRKAFEPFFSTKNKALHSGLSLSNVFGIVKEADGHIILDSEKGQGTNIQIFLPRAEGNVLE